MVQMNLAPAYDDDYLCIPLQKNLTILEYGIVSFYGFRYSSDWALFHSQNSQVH